MGKTSREEDSDSDAEPPPPAEASVEKKPQVTLPLPSAKAEMVIDRAHGYSSTTSMDRGPRGLLIVPGKAPPADAVRDGLSAHPVDGSPTSSLRRAKPAASLANTRTTHESSAKSLNSTAYSARSFKSAVTTGTACSSTSQRSHTSGGVPIRLPLLNRTDAIPCQMSGKRSICAPDATIRIFLLLPGYGHQISLWVKTDMPIGPPRPTKDRFTAIWGADAEEVGPFGTRANVPTKRKLDVESINSVPMNTHLKQVRSERNEADSLVVSVGLSPRKAKKERNLDGLDCMKNFRQLVEETTGIESANQKLFFNNRRIMHSEDEKTLADFGVGQGSVIMVQEIQKPQGAEVELCTDHARKKLFAHDPQGAIRGRLGSLAACLGKTRTDKEGSNKARIMLRWNNEAKPQLFHHDNDDGTCFDREKSAQDWDKNRRIPTNTDTFNYCQLPDNGFYDKCDKIRNRFDIIARSAAAVCAVAHMGDPAVQTRGRTA